MRFHGVVAGPFGQDTNERSLEMLLGHMERFGPVHVHLACHFVEDTLNLFASHSCMADGDTLPVGFQLLFPSAWSRPGFQKSLNLGVVASYLRLPALDQAQNS